MEEINDYVLSPMLMYYVSCITTTSLRYSISQRLYAFHWQHMSMLPSVILLKYYKGGSLFEQGIVTLDNNKERHPEIYKADKGNYQAAHIELYQPGFHARNIKVDFSAFYPSISMALNLGPDTTQIVGYDEYSEKTRRERWYPIYT